MADDLADFYAEIAAAEAEVAQQQPSQVRIPRKFESIRFYSLFE